MALTKVSTGVVDMSGSTGALEIAKGTTAERDAIISPTLGTLRANTTDNTMEVYTNNSGTPSWYALAEGGNAFVPLTVDYLVVAGGAGGGLAGGGAGGYRTSFGTGNINGGLTALENPLNLSPSITYTVTVGVGGVGANHNTRVPGYSGGNSAISGANITTITSTGGGGGGTAGASGPWTAGVDGGSGGGSHDNSSAGAAVTNPVQGFAGGVQNNTAGGGGGGAGSVGNSNTDGGLGLASTITGSSLQYAGGGGGYPSGGGTFGGGTATSTTGGSGTANTGGGGGGGLTPGSGGDGVVILRYPDAYSIAKTGSLTSSTAIVGTDNVTTFLSGTGTITFS